MNYIRREPGFTMIEMLLALSAVSLCAVLCSALIALLPRSIAQHYEAEDALALRQLRFLLAQADTFTLTQEQLAFRYHTQFFTLEQYGHLLVKRPGFEVMMQQVDHIRFFKQNECYYLSYTRQTNSKEALLACE